MGKNMDNMFQYFIDVKLVEEYALYFCSVEDALRIVIISTLCGLKNFKQTHQWQCFIN